MPFLLLNQQCQSNEGNSALQYIRKKTNLDGKNSFTNSDSIKNEQEQLLIYGGN